MRILHLVRRHPGLNADQLETLFQRQTNASVCLTKTLRILLIERRVKARYDPRNRHFRYYLSEAGFELCEHNPANEPPHAGD